MILQMIPLQNRQGYCRNNRIVIQSENMRRTYPEGMDMQRMQARR